MSDSDGTSPFMLLGGSLCLDFANTAFREDGVPIWESLNAFEDLVAWGGEVKLLTPTDRAELRSTAGEKPGEARAAFGRAVELREVVYRLFSGVAEHGGTDPRTLAALDRAQSEAFARRHLVPGAGEFRWAWEGGGGALDRVTWSVAESAARLLTEGELKRVRLCAGEGCTLLFLDTSRNGRRRWCDMRHCGNIAKVRRFRARQRVPAHEDAPGSQG